MLRWPIFNYFGNPMIFEFLFGVLIAQAPKQPKLTIPLLALATICLAFSPHWIGNVEMTLRVASAWRVLYWGVPAAMIVYACVSSEAAFSNRYWLVPLILGDASYSIYLFHPAIIEVPIWWPLRGLLAIGGGLAMWWLVERRLLAVRRFRLRHVAAVSPASQ